MLFSTLGSLSDEQKRFLATFQVEDYKYMPHPLFETPDLSLPMCEAEKLIIDTSWVGRLVSDMQSAKKTSKAIILTREEERDLFLRYNWYRKMIRDIQDAWKAAGMEDLTDEQVADLVELHGHVCRIETQIDIINTPMKVQLCGKLSAKNFADEAFCDHWSSVNFAMLRCIRGFDVAQGFKFSTYYHRAALTHILRDRKNERKYKTRFRAVSSYVTDSEEVEDYIQNIPAKESPSQEEVHGARKLYEIIAGRMEMPNPYSLNDFEKQVLALRYLDGDELLGDHVAVQAIANKISSERGKSLTKERVRQVLSVAHDKIRAYLDIELRKEKVEAFADKHIKAHKTLPVQKDEIPLPGQEVVYVASGGYLV